MPAIDPAALRVFVYDEIISRGLPPTLSVIATRFGVSPTAAKLDLGSLRIGKTILVHPESGEMWMAGPFSAIQTDYRVSSGGRTWWANCAWDMLGVPMIVGERVHIETKCTDCGEPITLNADPYQPPVDDLVVHFLLPARRWYDDIGFT